MRIITSGSDYIDIDAYACIVAYAELLQLMGMEAKGVSTAPLNSSITETVKSWPVELNRQHTPNSTDTFTLVDVSELEFFEKFVDLGRIDEVIDHHTGFEAEWQAKLGKGAVIEFVGAASTQIYEKWQAADKLNEMSQTSARLLATGILDNTLNLLANVTTERDKQAYEELAKIGNLSGDWPQQYFLECEAAILADLRESLQNDTKVKPLGQYESKITIGQLAVWDVKAVLQEIDTVRQTLGKDNQHWFLNLICIGEGKSYFVVSQPELRMWLGELLGLQFKDEIAVAERLWLRKEIIKKAQESLLSE